MRYLEILGGMGDFSSSYMSIDYIKSKDMIMKYAQWIGSNIYDYVADIDNIAAQLSNIERDVMLDSVIEKHDYETCLMMSSKEEFKFSYFFNITIEWALKYGFYSKNLKLVSEILEYHHDEVTFDSDILCYAISCGLLRYADLILSKMSPYDQLSNNVHLFATSAETGNIETMKLVAKYFEERVDGFSPNYIYAMESAIISDQTSMVEYVLSMGAVISVENVFSACDTKNPKITRVVCDYMRVDRDFQTFTVLDIVEHAVRSGSTECLDIVIDMFDESEITDIVDDVLICAVMADDYNMVDHVIKKYKDDRLCRFDKFHIAFDTARDLKYFGVAELFI